MSNSEEDPNWGDRLKATSTRISNLYGRARRNWVVSAAVALLTVLTALSFGAAKIIDTADKFLKLSTWFRSADPASKEANPKTAETTEPNRTDTLRCAEATSIGEAYEDVGPPPIGAKLEKFSDRLKGRRICGKGWPALFKQPVTINGQRIVIVGDNKGRKLQLQTDDGAWEFKENDPIWVTEAIFDEISEDESLVGHAAKITRREIVSKPIAKAPKAATQDDNNSAKNGSKDSEPSLGIFEFDWFTSTTPSTPKPTEKLRDKYTRD